MLVRAHGLAGLAPPCALLRAVLRAAHAVLLLRQLDRAVQHLLVSHTPLVWFQTTLTTPDSPCKQTPLGTSPPTRPPAAQLHSSELQAGRKEGEGSKEEGITPFPATQR